MSKSTSPIVIVSIIIMTIVTSSSQAQQPTDQNHTRRMSPGYAFLMGATVGSLAITAYHKSWRPNAMRLSNRTKTLGFACGATFSAYWLHRFFENRG